MVLMPLSLSLKCVMAGDHHQLPPMAKNCHLPSLKESLFEKLMVHNAAHKIFDDISTLLELQFRMNSLISLASSVYFYGSKLAPASLNQTWTAAEIARQTPASRLLDLSTPLVWVDHDNFETKKAAGGVCNLGEMSIILRLLNHLIVGCGVAPSQVTVITSFNYQKDLLLFSKHNSSEIGDFGQVDMSTIDGYQGRENEVIIYSAVRSNDKGQIGFLKEERRINVSITRAKRMFVLVGCSKLLCQDRKSFLSLVYNICTRYGDVFHFQQLAKGGPVLFSRVNLSAKKKLPASWDRLLISVLSKVVEDKQKGRSCTAKKSRVAALSQDPLIVIDADETPAKQTSHLASQRVAEQQRGGPVFVRTRRSDLPADFNWSAWLPRSENSEEDVKIIRNPAMLVRQMQAKKTAPKGRAVVKKSMKPQH
jgi:hypothetical protein